MKLPSLILCAAAVLVALPMAPPAYGDSRKAKTTQRDKAKKAKKPKTAKFDPEATPYENAVPVFQAGDDNPYVSIRIPIVIKAGKMLVAMAEGRYKDTDQGENDLIVSISKDGRKWSKPVVAAASKGATFNNPCMIYDAEAKQIVLMFQRYPAGVKERSKDIPTGWDDDRCIRNFVCFSKNGKKWSTPKDVTEFTKHADSTITCSGPNPGVQITRGEHKGRLVVTFNEATGFGNWVATSAYSDDHGKTWKMGQKSEAGKGINEISSVESDDGGVLVVSRAWGGGQRKVTTSADAGETWSPIISHPELPSPNCQNGMTRYSHADEKSKGNRSRILFSTPSKSNRSDGIIKMSYDGGKTWPVEKSVGQGPFAYSALCPIKPGLAGLIFEVNGAPIKTIMFAPFTLDWLTDGADDGKASSSGEDETEE